ncbi:MAG TPA: MFS transporter, partial [Nevskiaceae bacterium]|nr:MFS transporter [Nevskiaceae bacterium]
NCGFALCSFASYGASAWIPTFMQRTYGWNIQQIGLAYGLVIMIFGSAGIVVGGRLSDRMMRKGISEAPLRVGLWGALGTLPFGALYPLMPTGLGSVLMMAPTVFFLAMPFGVAPAAIADIVPPAMRGQASAVYLFIVNLIGLGLGPTAVALFTDQVLHDPQAIRWSLMWVGGAALAGAVALLSLGLAPYRASWSRLHATS